MKPLCVLLVGVAVGWAASGVDWSREAVGQEQIADEDVASEFAGRSVSRAEQIANAQRELRRIGELFRPPAPSNPVGRFQVSAFGSPNGTGCYVVDSTTGQTWLIRNGQPPEVVTKSLLDATETLSRSLVTPDRVPPPTTPADQSNPGVVDELQTPQAN